MRIVDSFILGVAALGIGANNAVVARADTTRTDTTVATRPADGYTTSRLGVTVDDAARPAQVRTKFTHAEYEEALQTAAKLGRPLVIKIGASWCGPCQQMARNAFPDAGVQKLLKDGAVFVDIEVDKHGDSAANAAKAKKLVQDYAIRGYPTTMIVTLKKDAKGNLAPQVQKSKAGGMSAAQLRAYLSDARNGLSSARKIMQANGFGVAAPANR